MEYSMSKFILNFFIFCLFGIFLFYKAFALDDGVYSGVYKLFYAHSESDSKKGDKGVFEFTIKNNKVVKLFAYDVLITNIIKNIRNLFKNNLVNIKFSFCKFLIR